MARTALLAAACGIALTACPFDTTAPPDSRPFYCLEPSDSAAFHDMLFDFGNGAKGSRRVSPRPAELGENHYLIFDSLEARRSLYPDAPPNPPYLDTGSYDSLVFEFDSFSQLAQVLLSGTRGFRFIPYLKGCFRDTAATITLHEYEQGSRNIAFRISGGVLSIEYEDPYPKDHSRAKARYGAKDGALLYLDWWHVGFTHNDSLRLTRTE
jgi:hypothetical protein